MAAFQQLSKLKVPRTKVDSKIQRACAFIVKGNNCRLSYEQLSPKANFFLFFFADWSDFYNNLMLKSKCSPPPRLSSPCPHRHVKMEIVLFLLSVAWQPGFQLNNFAHHGLFLRAGISKRAS